MQRSKFIVGLISIFPISAFSRVKSFQKIHKGFKVAAGEGRDHGHMKLLGVNSNILDMKISGKDTDGGLAVFEQTSISPGRGTPLHIHYKQDEIFYVVKGDYFFQVGDDKHRLSTGDTIFLPRNIPHAWTQVSETGKMTVTFQPAGKMEEFFLAVSSLNKAPIPAEIAKLFENSDMKVVGPPLKLK